MTVQFIDGKSSKISDVLARGCRDAALLLCETTGQQLALAVSEVDFLTVETRVACAEIGEQTTLIGASQEFSGELSGQALLLLEADKGLTLVRALLGQHRDPDFMTEIDQSALTEIVNIVINACLHDLAKGCRGEVRSSVPAPVNGTLVTILRGGADVSADTMSLCLNLTFRLAEDQISARLLLTPAASFAGFWQAAVRDVRIPMPVHG
jgi:chemotaxis protein CheY-P-specific phosphatase CheC